MDVTTINPELFRGLSVYQDVRIHGQTVLQGARDCEGRWKTIEPYLPDGGALLDIGSNFGWFGLRWCERFADGVVVSIEADERSALVQREVLAANEQDRIFLLTAKAGAGMMRRFQRAGQRFDAALLFSILHWVRDHRAMLEALGQIAGRIFVEQPDPREEGAGDERIRREIGPIGPYLGRIFPDRSVVHLATWPSHRPTEYPRELWMVDSAAGTLRVPSVSAGDNTTKNQLHLPTLLDLEPAWPPRSWWEERDDLSHFRHKIRRLPETGVVTPARRWKRNVQRIASQARRWFYR